MNLHVDSYGSGAPLLLIHGWGMHGGMWGGVAEQLAEHFRVLVVDLPGHGYSAVSSEWRVVSGKQIPHLPLTTSSSIRATPACQCGRCRAKVFCSFCVFSRELAGRLAGVG